MNRRGGPCPPARVRPPGFSDASRRATQHVPAHPADLADLMPTRLAPLCLPALLALAAADAGAQATTLPLPPPESAPASTPMQRQSGMVVIAGDHDERAIVRSFEPDSVVGDYRIDFEALDANADDLLDRSEAKANPTLDAEFRAVDANNDGRLDRTELSGWIR